MSEAWQTVLLTAGSVLLGLVCYSYIGYPWLLRFLSGPKRRLDAIDLQNHDLPDVTVVMSVYNESQVIGQKLDSILASDYPSDRLNILIGSDCSSDPTEEIIQRYQDRYPGRIQLVRGENRAGKPAMLNVLRPMIGTGITLLTDANVYFESETVRKLVRHFADPHIGLVGANILNTGMRPDGISRQEEGYIQRENLMKFREGLIWGAMAGPFGGCYALRTSLFDPVPPNFLVDDFYICMRVLEQHYASILEPEAICYEDVTNEIQIEFRRKRRISAGNFQNLFRFSGLLNPFRGIGLALWSHKVLRWITPFLVFFAWCCFMAGWIGGNVISGIFAAGLMAVFLILPIDLLFRSFGWHVKTLRYGAYFILMNVALIAGFFRFLSGIKGGAWEPTTRFNSRTG